MGCQRPLLPVQCCDCSSVPALGGAPGPETLEGPGTARAEGSPVSVPWIPGKQEPSSTWAGKAAGKPQRRPQEPSPHSAVQAGIRARLGQTGRTTPCHTTPVLKPASQPASAGDSTPTQGLAPPPRDWRPQVPPHPPAGPSIQGSHWARPRGVTRAPRRGSQRKGREKVFLLISHQAFRHAPGAEAPS